MADVPEKFRHQYLLVQWIRNYRITVTWIQFEQQIGSQDGNVLEHFFGAKNFIQAIANVSRATMKKVKKTYFTVCRWIKCEAPMNSLADAQKQKNHFHRFIDFGNG